ncbi:MAG TPA: SpoIIE family protein phosphatase [Acidimicrobiales bacterium]|nr:SpoIIE family protein phosphatase [Acidimicrobiales bacterium]
MSGPVGHPPGGAGDDSMLAGLAGDDWPLALVDGDTRCTHVSEALAGLLDCANAFDLVGRKIDEVLADAEGRLGDDVRRVFETGRASSRVVGTDDGTARRIFRCIPARSGTDAVDLAIVVVTDTVAPASRLELAHRRTAALQQIASAFAAAVTPEVVADVVVDVSLGPVDAIGCSLHLLDDTGARLCVVTSAYPTGTTGRYLDLAIDDKIPIAQAVATRTPIWIADLDELVQRYPDAVGPDASAARGQAHAAIPLLADDEPLGVLVFSWQRPRRFDRDDRDFLLSIAAHCAQALHRAALFRAERDARTHTERAADQALRLERITGRLASAYEQAEVIGRFLDNGLAELGAIYGSVFEIDEATGILRSLGHRSTTERSEWLVRLDEDSPLAEAARTGEPVILPNPAAIRARTGSTRDVEEIGAAWATVPLMAYGSLVGVMSLRFETERTDADDDPAFLLMVGQRLGEAIERARLYEHERRSRERAEAAVNWLRSVQSLAAALARSATRAEVANALREHLQLATGAQSAFVASLGDDSRTIDVFRSSGASILTAPELARTVRRTIRDAIARGRPVELATEQEVRATFPHLAASGVARFSLYPIRARQSVIAVIGLAWSASSSPEVEGDAATERLLAIAASLGGAAFERATAHDTDHLIADTLQRQLLTEPDVSVPELEWAARYTPGSEQLTAGGDWYDVIKLDDRRVALVAGDIVGHGVEAAAAMGQLRSATRALAVRESPAELLEALDQYTTSTRQGDLSSLAYVVVDLERRWVDYAVAGHPPLLVRHADGRVRLVEDERGPLLGLESIGGRRAVGFPLEAGDVIVLYTDGLVERRGESIDLGLDRLRALVASMPTDLHPDGMCDRLLDGLHVGGPKTDDVTLLVVSFTPIAKSFHRFYPARLSMLRVIRSEVRRWSAANDIVGADAEDLLIAIGEASANAVQHGSANGATFVELSLVCDAGHVVARVIDRGVWLDPTRPAERGHGLHIMQAVMDTIEIRTSDIGTVVEMRHLRNRADRRGDQARMGPARGGPL